MAGCKLLRFLLYSVENGTRGACVFQHTGPPCGIIQSILKGPRLLEVGADCQVGINKPREKRNLGFKYVISLLEFQLRAKMKNDNLPKVGPNKPKRGRQETHPRVNCKQTREDQNQIGPGGLQGIPRNPSRFQPGARS